MSEIIDRLNKALEGRYLIERPLGEGGMAMVYLANDLKHDRKVALKVLRPELAAVVGAERFLAEIKTTAHLQHPHILPLFDSGEADTFLFFVMPYVEGETLRDRLDREKQLPVDEAVGIARSLGEALAYAHGEGVIHRDIKPANILMLHGKPVISDFGIALAVSAGGAGRLTETGLSLGTPYYMSPEQATGEQNVGPVTDVWALGCVLYETLVGAPPYVGPNAQAVLGKIITETPESATRHRKTVPANVDAAIRKALERLPADRFSSAQEFVRALSDPSFRHGEVAGLGAGPGVWRWVAAGPRPVARFEAPFREGQAPFAFGSAAQALSPDGSMLVYRVEVPGVGNQLFVRRWDDPEALPIRGTENGFMPAVSPDGTELAFTKIAEDGSAAVKVLSFDGGPVRTLTAGTWPRWGANGEIYVQQDSGEVRIPGTGGAAETIPRGDPAPLLLWVLPGGKKGLCERAAAETVEVCTLDLETGETKGLTPGVAPSYLPSGHLLLLQNSTLVAAPFDARSGEMRGPVVPVLEGVLNYSVSETGDLVYGAGSVAGGLDRELVWVTREGSQSPVGWSFASGGGNNYHTWRLSPDGSQVALMAVTEGNRDIWVKSLPDGPPRRLTFDDGVDYTPWWSADGSRVTYLNAGNVWSVAANGTGAPTLVFDGERGFRNGVWSPEGTWLVLRTQASVTGPVDQPDRDLLGLRPGTDTVTVPLVATEEFAEDGPAISPDGRWLAYVSTETGRFEVWVRPFPDVDSDKIRISLDGGFQPRWAHSGRELFFISGERELVSATLDASSGGLRVVSRQTLFTLPPDVFWSAAADPYDVAMDDQSFLMARSVTQGSGQDAPHYVLVQNFMEELKKRVPVP